MRLGVSTSFSFTNAENWIQKHVEAGCKTVVFPLNCEASKEDITSFAKAAKANDITIAEVGIWRNPLAVDPIERKKSMEYSIGQLRLADEIGARCCVNVVGTPHGPRWDGGYKENFSAGTRKEIVKSIQTIIDEAKPTNTKFTIEPMPWMVPTGPDDYLRLIEEVGRDEFAVHLDVINMINSIDRYFGIDEFLEECFDKLGPQIRSCHLKDVRLLEPFTVMLQECACGMGVLDIPKYVKLTEKYDLDMPMIIEHLENDEAYYESLKYVKGLLNK